MKRLMLLPVLFLAACGTPQEQCIAGSTRDARVVNDLIRETEANLARGYALETGIEMKPDWIDCTPTPTPENPTPPKDMCFEDVPTEVTRPVAIDLNAEQAKLASLREKQASQAVQAQAIITECRIRYPE